MHKNTGQFLAVILAVLLGLLLTQYNGYYSLIVRQGADANTPAHTKTLKDNALWFEKR